MTAQTLWPCHLPGAPLHGSRRPSCRCLAERTIDDWLSLHGVEHQIEPVCPAHPELNAHGGLRADWQLADGTYVEYAGRTNDDYVAKIRTKQQLALRTGIKLVVITPPDLADLSELLGSAHVPSAGGTTSR
ncbi:hypothetical protein [Streptomyces gardneri]|uniref:hypothetical protein n=1 Tax=Streptomyces gardneri TaxID=66892 RepID=UPI0033CB6355